MLVWYLPALFASDSFYGCLNFNPGVQLQGHPKWLPFPRWWQRWHRSWYTPSGHFEDDLAPHNRSCLSCRTQRKPTVHPSQEPKLNEPKRHPTPPNLRPLAMQRRWGSCCAIDRQDPELPLWSQRQGRYSGFGIAAVSSKQATGLSTTQSNRSPSCTPSSSRDLQSDMLRWKESIAQSCIVYAGLGEARVNIWIISCLFPIYVYLYLVISPCYHFLCQLRHGIHRTWWCPEEYQMSSPLTRWAHSTPLALCWAHYRWSPQALPVPPQSIGTLGFDGQVLCWSRMLFLEVQTIFEQPKLGIVPWLPGHWAVQIVVSTLQARRRAYIIHP